MEQNRNSKNRPTHSWTNDFQERAKAIQWKKEKLSTNDAGTIRYPYTHSLTQSINGSIPHTMCQINPKCIIGLTLT